MTAETKGANIARLMELEQRVRRAENLRALSFTLVNETRQLIPCSRAALLTVSGRRGFRLAAVSDLPNADRTTPFASFVERFAANQAGTQEPTVFSVKNTAGKEEAEWRDLAPPEAALVPLATPHKGEAGSLIMFRDTPWTERELFLLEHLSEVYSHALLAFGISRKSRFLSGGARSFFLWLFLTVLLFAGFLPVRMSALAPVEITPKDPRVVTSPLNGIVSDIPVRTNDTVGPGQLVALLEDTEFRNRVAVAEQSLQVAKVALDKGERTAFQDSASSGKIAELLATLKLRHAELAYARELLAKTRLTADTQGIAVVTDPVEWQGKPVSVGQKILMIANPGQVEMKIMLPVSEALTLEVNSPVRVFLDSDPLSPLTGQVTRWEYEPRLTPSNTFAYQVTATLEKNTPTPRIGLRGTAKVHGPRVPFYYYLFRRPLTALRQRVGW